MYLIESPFPVIRLMFHKRKMNPQPKKECLIELKKQKTKTKQKDPCEITAHFIAKYLLPRVTTTQKFTIFTFFLKLYRVLPQSKLYL